MDDDQDDDGGGAADVQLDKEGLLILAEVGAAEVGEEAAQAKDK